VAGDRVEWIKRQVEAWNAGDIDGFLDGLGPDFEFTPDPSFPDLSTYRGDELRRWLNDWARVWDQNRFEVLGIEEREHALIVDSRWELIAPQVEAQVPVQDFAIVLGFPPGESRANRMWAFFDRDLALGKAEELTG
jgi:ketosteroid isomerase-like protein